MQSQQSKQQEQTQQRQTHVCVLTADGRVFACLVPTQAQMNTQRDKATPSHSVIVAHVPQQPQPTKTHAQTQVQIETETLTMTDRDAKTETNAQASVTEVLFSRDSRTKHVIQTQTNRNKPPEHIRITHKQTDDQSDTEMDLFSEPANLKKNKQTEKDRDTDKHQHIENMVVEANSAKQLDTNAHNTHSTGTRTDISGFSVGSVSLSQSAAFDTQFHFHYDFAEDQQTKTRAKQTQQQTQTHTQAKPKIARGSVKSSLAKNKRPREDTQAKTETINTENAENTEPDRTTNNATTKRARLEFSVAQPDRDRNTEKKTEAQTETDGNHRKLKPEMKDQTVQTTSTHAYAQRAHTNVHQPQTQPSVCVPVSLSAGLSASHSNTQSQSVVSVTTQDVVAQHRILFVDYTHRHRERGERQRDIRVDVLSCDLGLIVFSPAGCVLYSHIPTHARASISQTHSSLSIARILSPHWAAFDLTHILCPRPLSVSSALSVTESHNGKRDAQTQTEDTDVIADRETATGGQTDTQNNTNITGIAHFRVPVWVLSGRPHRERKQQDTDRSIKMDTSEDKHRDRAAETDSNPETQPDCVCYCQRDTDNTDNELQGSLSALLFGFDVGLSGWHPFDASSHSATHTHQKTVSDDSNTQSFRGVRVLIDFPFVGCQQLASLCDEQEKQRQRDREQSTTTTQRQRQTQPQSQTQQLNVKRAHVHVALSGDTRGRVAWCVLPNGKTQTPRQTTDRDTDSRVLVEMGETVCAVIKMTQQRYVCVYSYAHVRFAVKQAKGEMHC